MSNTAIKQLYVIGNPVTHSLSPLMHNRVIQECDLNANYSYKELDVASTSEGIRSFIENPKEEIVGINVTYPFKNTAYDACDETSDEAQKIFSVNTIVNSMHSHSKSHLQGFTTDGEGFLLSLGDYKIPNEVAVLGAGGAASSIILVLEALAEVERIYIYVRNEAKAEQAFKAFNKVKIKPITSFVKERFIINATPIGMGEQLGQVPINTDQYDECFVYDTIYHPKFTSFLRQAKEKGCEIQNGLGMLAGQAAIAFQKFFPNVIDTTSCYDLMIKAAYEHLK